MVVGATGAGKVNGCVVLAGNLYLKKLSSTSVKTTSSLTDPDALQLLSILRWFFEEEERRLLKCYHL